MITENIAVTGEGCSDRPAGDATGRDEGEREGRERFIGIYFFLIALERFRCHLDCIPPRVLPNEALFLFLKL